MPTRKQRVLGLELTPTGAHAALVSLGGDKVELTDSLQWESTTEATARLRELMAKVPGDVTLAVSLSNRQVWSRLIELPILKKSDLDTALTSRLHKFLPHQSDAWSLFSSEARIPGLDGSRRAWFATLASNSGIKSLLKMLEPFSSRWSNRQVEIPARSLLRLLLFERPALRNGVHLAVHVTESDVLVWACSEGTLVMSREVDLAPIGPGNPNFDDPASVMLIAKQVHAAATWLRLRTLTCEVPPADLCVTGSHAHHPALLEALRAELGLPQVTIQMSGGRPSGSEVACGLSLFGID